MNTMMLKMMKLSKGNVVVDNEIRAEKTIIKKL